MPSQKYLKEEVLMHVKELNVDSVEFRNKKFGIFNFSINIKGENVFNQNWVENPYFYTFMKSITYRENCYNCYYAQDLRCSDITIGDYWGLSRDSKMYKDKVNGVSVVLIMTNNGQELLESVSKNISLEERNPEEAIKGNGQLQKPAPKSKYVEKFRKIYKNNNDFYGTYKRVCFKNYIKQKIKSIRLVNNVLNIMKRRKVWEKAKRKN